MECIYCHLGLLWHLQLQPFLSFSIFRLSAWSTVFIHLIKTEIMLINIIVLAILYSNSVIRLDWIGMSGYDSQLHKNLSPQKNRSINNFLKQRNFYESINVWEEVTIYHLQFGHNSTHFFLIANWLDYYCISLNYSLGWVLGMQMSIVRSTSCRSPPPTQIKRFTSVDTTIDRKTRHIYRRLISIHKTGNSTRVHSEYIFICRTFRWECSCNTRSVWPKAISSWPNRKSVNFLGSRQPRRL